MNHESQTISTISAMITIMRDTMKHDNRILSNLRYQTALRSNRIRSRLNAPPKYSPVDLFKLRIAAEQ